MADHVLRKIILDTVLPMGSILEEGENFFSTTTYNLDENELAQIEKLRDCGVRFVVSAWPRGVYKPDFKNKAMEGRLVLRFEWDSIDVPPSQSVGETGT